MSEQIIEEMVALKLNEDYCGICPVTRCTKGLLNGACGGSKDGKCELSPKRTVLRF